MTTFLTTKDKSESMNKCKVIAQEQISLNQGLQFTEAVRYLVEMV